MPRGARAKKAGIFALLLWACAACTPQGKTYSGYVEGEYVYVAPTTAGILATLAVERGQQVAKGEALFALDKTALEASRLAAVADSEKVQAAVESDGKAYIRAHRLFPSGAVSQAELDASKAAYAASVAAAKSAEQKLVQIKRQLAEIAPTAAVASRVEDTYFRAGEFVAAGTPVVSLLPPENVKIRFFVPQAELARFALQAPIAVSCDGCGKPRLAKISFIASQSEYTPPVIYSVGSRDKLVFMIEAKPDAFDPVLRPGLPVDVALASP